MCMNRNVKIIITKLKEYSVIYPILILLFTYKNWFLPGTFASGDWVYKYPNSTMHFTLPPSVWDPLFGDSVGANSSFLLALNTYYVNSIYLFINIVRLPWETYERLIWYLPCIFIAFFSTRKLFKQNFSKKEFYASLAGLLYTTNSYFLMVVGGGQIAVGLSIAFAPLVLHAFITIMTVLKHKDLDEKNFLFLSVIAGFVLSLQLMIDLRFTYITICAISIAFFINIFIIKRKRKFLLYYFVIPFIIMILLHAFWLLVFVISGKNALAEMGTSYTSIESLRFFSTARIENTIGLMHPYWPENIFGKVGFMKPEFLIYPLFAFGSLLFIDKHAKNNSKNYNVLFFALLGIIGIFLAKGSTDPLGEMYIWMFEYIPGFVMFRDPTKWYLFIAIAYSMLIPFTIQNISSFISTEKKLHRALINILIVVLLGLLFIPIRQVFLGQLNGTFKPQVVSEEYTKLYTYVSLQQEYFRTYWIPKQSNLAYSSYMHPLIAAGNLINESDPNKLLQKFAKSEKNIQEAGVKYVIIPYASRGDMFLKDHKYHEQSYTDTVASVSAISWLREVEGFGKIKVYEVSDYKEHVWMLNNKKQKIQSITYIKPTQYDVEIVNGNKGDIVVFSEGYDPLWYMKTPEGKVFSKKYNLYNSFQLPSDGTYKVSIVYEPQKYVVWGSWISSISLIALLLWMIYLKRNI